jgi:hypothetical protein
VARIAGVALGPELDERIARVLRAQAERWGAPLANHLVYARCPALFHAVRGMWSGLDAAGRIDPRLRALLNRRVAALNGCEF